MIGETYFAIDTETTGFMTNLPVEIAAVVIHNRELKFCQRVKQTFIEHGARKVHGITVPQLADCDDEKTSLINLLNFISQHCDNGNTKTSPVFVAHNASYDRDRVLYPALKRHNLHLPSGSRWICTVEMSKNFWRTTAFTKYRHSLKDCCERVGIPYVDSHSALPDASMCADFFETFYHSKCDQDYAEARRQINEEDYQNDIDQYESIGL